MEMSHKTEVAGEQLSLLLSDWGLQLFVITFHSRTRIAKSDEQLKN